MKKLVILQISILLCLLSFSQNGYYYADGQQVYWTTDSTSANIIVKNTEDYSQIVNNLKGIFTGSSDEIIGDDEDDNIIINSNSLKTMNISTLISSISVKTDDIAFFTFSKLVNGKHLWLRNDLYVKLSDTTKFQQFITGMFNTYEVLSFNYEGSGEYKMVCNNESKMMQLANRLHDSTWTIYSTPDFYSDIILSSNDTHYSEQWGIKNTGQTGGTADIDVNAEGAWNFLQSAIGSNGLSYKVAVIDDGVEDHEDLFNNVVSKVLSGYTANGIGDGSPKANHKHGQACAGIISATQNNNMGITGIAPSTLIVPIRIFKQYGSFSDSKIAKAIKKSWYNYDASVLSNSWGYNDTISRSQITNAIQEASIYGRNGKGCVVVFASGNECTNYVLYPATVNGVISVGAVDKCGIRSGRADSIPYSCDPWPIDYRPGSSYGDKLSVVAPGTNVYTIDRMGIKGKYPENYYHDFGGTSAACPFVSGVACLVLSINPNLTASQVKTIIEKSAQKIRMDIYTYGYYPTIHPNGTWNKEVGYGLVNALGAVMEAYFYNYSVSGTASVSPCNTYTYSVSNSTMPNGTTLTWTTSSNIEIVSGLGTSSVVVRPIGSGNGWVSANYTYEGYTVTKTKNVTITSGYTTCYNNYTASGSMTLGMNSVIAGTFTITDGNTVTINSTTYCSPDAKIVINPGGKLVVDGGIITNLCSGKMWKGIRVLGNKNQRQLAQYQGTLEIKNGSVISNAKDAISTWDGDDYNTTGGIVKCTNSTFLNNRRSAEFMAYINHTSTGIETSNVSYFKNCNFTIDDNNIFTAAGVTYSDIITMWGVNGVAIRGCHFSDVRTGSPTRGNAITLASAGAYIKPSCTYGDYSIDFPCFCTGESNNTFSGFAKGVNAENTGTNYPFNVFKADFEQCLYPVYSSGVNNYKVTMSDFDLPINNGQGPTIYGIYSTDCSGYKIEANELHSNNNVNNGPLGIYVANSGSDENKIYRNTFNNITVCIYSTNNPALQILCNEFSNTHMDILAVSYISPLQGTSAKSAGNKFASGATNICTINSNALTYYYSGPNLPSNPYYPYSISSSNVSTAVSNAANDCEPTICLPPTIIDPPIVGPIIGKSAPVNNDISLYESLQQMYDSRLADYDAAGYDFLLENFEDGDADIVATARLMQDTLVSIRRAMAEIANRNIDAILQDTVVFDRESLNGWYNRINTQTAKYSLVNSYFEMGEYALARQELATIPQRFALTTDELAEYDNFCQYQSLREAVYTDGRNYAQLTEDEIAELQIIVERNTGVSSAYANSVLCFFYGICRDEEIDIDFDIDIDAPMNSKSTTAVSEESTSEEPLAIYVYPNPADNELNILFNSLPKGRTTIEFHDVAGRLMFVQEINSTNARIDISSLPQGVYMCRIVNGENIIARDRIVKE